uniref:Uncharacterized protein n=1 Tax=Caenorhabditis japonica TaxID=281687 RepID=A0A8R1EC39_CAEJA
MADLKLAKPHMTHRKQHGEGKDEQKKGEKKEPNGDRSLRFFYLRSERKMGKRWKKEEEQEKKGKKRRGENLLEN